MATKQDIVDIATQAVLQRRAGDRFWTHNGIAFDLDEIDMCLNLVVRVHEAAMGLSEHGWEYDSDTARHAEWLLRDAGKQTATPEPGDIICMNNQSYPAGHIGLLMPGDRVAENCSIWRGNPAAPGTKLTPLAECIGELSAYYSVLPSVAKPNGYEKGNLVVKLGDQQVDAWFTGDHAIVGVRALADLLGYDVADDIPAHRAVVLTKKAGA